MSTDGTNFSTILASYSVIQAGLAGTNTLAWSTANGVQSAFTTTVASIAGADNQATLIFRFVNLSTVATGGTNRIDNIVVSSGPIPAPGAIALLGLAGLATRRRR
jgi:MYXO-CTERM domain-containing protein